MNIRISLTILALLFSFQLIQAQDSLKTKNKKVIIAPTYPRSGYVAILGGLVDATGSFASDAGAAPGAVFAISAAFPGIISHWGIAFKFDDGINGYNTNRLIDILNSNAGFGTINSSLPDGLGHFSYTTLLTGINLTYPHAHFTMDVRILMGVMTASMPALTVNYYDQLSGNNGDSYQAATSSSGFAIDFGFDVRYPITKRLSVLLSVDYLHSAPTFTIVKTGASLSSYGSIIQNGNNGQEATMSQSFNILNLSLGLGYTISAKQ